MSGIDPRQIVSGLVQRGVPVNAAIALVGNSRVESGWNPGINEVSPLVPGSRGGFGLWQHTGPRRRQLESFAAQRGTDPSDVDTQLDFVVWELGNTETRARDRIYGAQSVDDAARLVSTEFLRPGIPHLDRRIAAAREVAGMDNTMQQAFGGRGGEYADNALAMLGNQPQQQNALAQFAPRTAMTDPRMFMTQNALRQL